MSYYKCVNILHMLYMIIIFYTCFIWYECILYDMWHVNKLFELDYTLNPKEMRVNACDVRFVVCVPTL